MRILRLLVLGSVLLGPGAAPPSASGADAPAVPVPPDEDLGLSTLDGDPGRIATPAHEAARAHLVGAGGAPDPDGAAVLWMDLAEKELPALLPAPRERATIGSGGTEEGLLLPATEAAIAAIGLLPPSARAVVEARWGGRAGEAIEAARAGAPGAVGLLEEAARRWPVTAAGGLALRLLADLAMEAGDPDTAARHLGRWMRLHPYAAPDAFTAAAVRLADALVELRDEAGLLLLARRVATIAAHPAATREGPVPVGEIATRAIAACRRRLAEDGAAAPAPPGSERPSSLRVLWALDRGDDRLVGRGANEGEPGAVAVDGDDVFLADARRVRRLDRETGLTRWTWPPALPRAKDPRRAARSFEMPVRDVVVAGGLVLAVLGDPVVASVATEVREDGTVGPAERGRGARSRVVAFDRETGRPVWWTGGLDETDAVLGADDVGVTSPVLVDGARLHLVVAARRDAVETWLATLDTATGRVLRTTSLVRGESGFVDPASASVSRGLADIRVRGLPRAQRPVRAGDEICVVTGAGSCAGVDARTGERRWVRSLPRWFGSRRGDLDRFDDTPSGFEHAATNEPLPVGGDWIVAAEDAPRSVAIERGTGRLRWAAPEPGSAPGRGARTSERAGPPHLLGARVDAAGRRSLLFGGAGLALQEQDALSGRPRDAASLVPFDGAAHRSDARPFEAPDAVFVFGEARVRAARRSGPDGAWREDPSIPVVPATDPEIAEGGALRRDGRGWLLVRAGRLVALAPPEEAARIARGPGRDAADRAARACLRARLEPGREVLLAAIAATEPRPDLRREVLPAAVDAWLGSPEGLAACGSAATLPVALGLVDALPPASRAAAYRRILDLLEREQRPEAAVVLLDAWLAFGDETLVPTDPSGGTRVRSDLYAASRILPFAHATPAGRAALERREGPAEARLRTADGGSTRACDEALRRTAGTRAAFFARARFLARRIDDGDAESALSLAAAWRTSVVPGVTTGAASAHALRALEGELLATRNEPEAARRAFADAATDGPALARLLDGGPASHLADELVRFGGGPVPDDPPAGRLELFAPGAVPTAFARQDARILEAIGGREPVGPVVRLVVGRGLERELVSWPGGATVPLPSVDAGHLGAVLEDPDVSLPEPGVRVASVTAGGAADRAGLRAGDWIRRFGDADATDRDALVRAIACTAQGTVVPVVLGRAGRSVTRPVVLARRESDERAPRTPEIVRRTSGDRVLSPARFGLEAIDLGAGTTTPFWRARAPGTLDAMAGRGDLVVAVLGASTGDATIVGLSATDGTERFATTIEGRSAGPPRFEGGAIVVDAVEPATTWILDADTGAVRAAIDRAVAPYGVPRRDLRHPGSVGAGGTLFLWRSAPAGRTGRAPGRLELVAVDPETAIVSEPLDTPAPPARELGRPRLAAGTLVAATVCDEEITVLLPDLRGGIERFGTLRIDGPRFGSSRWGVLDDDSLVGVGGDVVYVARITRGDGLATIGAVELDRRRARGLSPEDPALWHPPSEPLLAPRTSGTVDEAMEEEARFGALRVEPEGAWIGVTSWRRGAEGAPGRTAWFESGGEVFAPVSTASSILYERPPVLVGPYAFVPSDGGYVVVRRRPLRPR